MYNTTQTHYLCSLSEPSVDLAGVLYGEMIKALQLDADYVLTHCSDAAAGFAAVKALGFKGFSCSMPHKQAIIEHLDRVAPLATQIGAVNTVSLENNQWVGYNTDWYGAVEALKEVTSINGKSILLIGAGGAAKAVAYGLLNEGAKLTISNRSPAAGEDLAEQLGGLFIPLADLGSSSDFDVVINTTSLGFIDDQRSPVADTYVSEGQVAFDIVFDPTMTPFLINAQKNGARLVQGHKMLIHQAILQFKIWLGCELKDYSQVEQALLNYIAAIK